tara:strand:- start:431 stop:766 length:336 start_codon:yes stop_codon:yes gene_type:complete
MNRSLTLTIFLSVILFSCSKSTEDKIVGTWQSEGEIGIMTMTITFNSDKTMIMSSIFSEEIDAWKFNEVTMEICIGESSEEADECFPLISVDDHRLCIKDQGEISCLNKYK